MNDSPGAIARGLAWNGLAQLFQAALSFCSMLVLVRIIPRDEYGRASSVSGILMVLGAFGCATFLSHALQLRDGEEPDWSTHWAAALRIQTFFCVLANAVAGVAWMLPSYRPIAPLLHIGALGVFIEAPAQLRFAQLRRSLDFRRMRITIAIGTVCTTIITLVLGVAGFGAYALVFGANVLGAVPMAVDLLFVTRFRPTGGWLAPLRIDRYRAPLRFGLKLGSLGALFSARAALPGMILPATLGFGALGELGRSQSLINLSAGRGLGILVETVYPLLPRHVGDPPRLVRYARLLATMLGWVIVPSVLFVTFEGGLLVRVLYGGRWSSIVPLLPAAALGFAGQAAMTLGNTLLLARERMRASFAVEATATVLTLVAVLATPRFGLLAVAAGVATAMSVAGLVALLLTHRDFGAGWLFSALGVPALAAGSGAAALVALSSRLALLRPPLALALAAGAFCLVVLFVLRVAAPRTLAEVIAHLPAGARIARVLLLRVEVEA